jgi:hypothetical protein
MGVNFWDCFGKSIYKEHVIFTDFYQMSCFAFWKVPGPNLDTETGYSTVFLEFPQSLQANAGIVRRQFQSEPGYSLFPDVSIGCEPTIKIILCRDGTSMFI